MRREFPDGTVILGVITYGAERIARLAHYLEFILVKPFTGAVCPSGSISQRSW